MVVSFCICSYFQTTRIKFLKKIFFIVWSGKKRVLVHLRILSDHQKHGRAQKWCYFMFEDAFVLMHLRILPDHQNQVLKKIFFNVWSGKNVFWCICASFQTTKIKLLKKIFFNVWSGKTRVLVHLRILLDHQKHGLKNYVI